MGTLVGLILTLISACGGGGGPQSAPPSAPPDRAGIEFGYYGDCGLAESFGHTSLAFIFGWCEDFPGQHAILAAQAGKKIILAVDWRAGDDHLRYLFELLRSQGALNSVVALYPEDEPDIAGAVGDPRAPLSEAQIRSFVAQCRRIAAEFGEIAGVNIAVIYGNLGTPAIDAFDWIGRDEYGPDQPQVLPLLPGQRLLIIPGGADPWRESPEPFVDYAQRHGEVAAIIPFLWRDPTGRRSGIGSNGMAPIYCQAGRRIIQQPGAC